MNEGAARRSPRPGADPRAQSGRPLALPDLFAGGQRAGFHTTAHGPQIRRQRTFEAIKRLLVRESLNQPIELLFEDLQWMDGETEAFLTFVIDRVASPRILLLVNYRPEYQHGWGHKNYYTQLRLDPLG